MLEPIDLEGFIKIFTFDKKRDLEKYCREVVVYRRDFVAFILACDAGRMPFGHRIHYCDNIPEHLLPSKSEHKALSENGVGPLKGDALKMVRKIFQLYEERRYIVGHMFYTPSLWEWHFFYFNQREVDEERPNHWKGGSHIHLINWLWPKHDAQSIWSTLTSGNAKFPNSFHIRYVSEPGKGLDAPAREG
jgi:hypothetical protein